MFARDPLAAATVWEVATPLFVLGAYFLVGAVVYLFRTLVFGAYHDAEVASRGSTVFLGMPARMYFAWIMRPIWRGFAALSIPPDAITTLSALFAVASGVAVAAGEFALGGWLYLFAGACDFVDGRLARETGQSRPSGAALDSVVDRYVEGALLVGLAWFYRDTWVLGAVLLALVGSLLVPYVRARGEGLGVEVRVGWMQRPERVVGLGVAVAFAPLVDLVLAVAPPAPRFPLAVVAIVVVGIVSNITALHRLVHVRNALDRVERTKNGAADDDTDADGHRSAKTLIKNAIAGAVATAFDFGLVVLLVESGLDPRIATALGCGLGAVINFGMNRAWTFAVEGAVAPQAARYAVVSASSAALNAGGVAVMLLLPALDYRLGWWLVRGLVYLTWNYPLHRDYVFAREVAR